MEKEKLLKAQNLSYNCAVEIAKEIRDGWTEKQTAKLMDTYLKDHGIKTFFHTSFAWFGPRSAFYGIKHYLDFLPKKQVYQDGDVVILDTAPIVDGYIGDIGFTFSKVPNEELKKAREFLVKIRTMIRSSFLEKKPTSIVWQDVDKMIAEHSYTNCYERYPFSVLGHRVGKAKAHNWNSFAFGFGIQAYLTTLAGGIKESLLTKNHASKPVGAWAIEPHIGLKDFGAKFEEILLVTEDSVEWLTDEVPHLNLPQGLY
ncbi:MAG: aminopeptidase P family protein [Bdellovibrionales bacterium]|nr:aminopeptidase P family protein [Bdellovibrionales bacterium]